MNFRSIQENLCSTNSPSSITGMSAFPGLYIPIISYPGVNIQKCVKKQNCKHHLTQTDNKNTYLHDYINDLLQSEAKYPTTKVALHIVATMKDVCRQVCEYLHERYPLFKNCYVIEAGSIFEELKVGGADEFDFMIIVPQLSNEKVVKFRATMKFQLLEYDIIDKSMFELDDQDDNNFFNFLDDILQNILKDTLPVNWKLNSEFTAGKFICATRIAHTFQLLFEDTEHINHYIDCDFCFAAPLYKLPIWHSSTPIYQYGSTLMQSPFPLFYIFRSESCRLSFSAYEKAIVNQYDLNSLPKSLLRLAKVVRNKLLPQKYDHNTRSMSPLVSTYWLKTLIYMELSHRNCEHCWENMDITKELIHLFEKLHHCVLEGKLYSFFIPEYNLLANYSTEHRFATFRMTNYPIQPKYYEEKAVLLNSLDTLISNLRELYNNKSLPIPLDDLESELKVIAKVELEKKLREELFDMLYYYAYNDADDDLGYETMKTFIAKQLPMISLAGKGYDIILTENGRHINIDECLTQRYDSNDSGEPFNYFALSK